MEKLQPQTTLFTKCPLVITEGRAGFSVWIIQFYSELRVSYRKDWIQTQGTYSPDCVNTWTLNTQVPRKENLTAI